jgi:c(7)-type cytochrome triheme protein
MRVLVVAVVMALAAIASAAPERAIGFDHVVHDGQVTVTGAAAIPCSDCHALGKNGRLRGRPGHAACFGACHGAAPTKKTPRTGDREKVCAACHAEKSSKVAYPPYALDPDFGLALSHAAHDQTVPCRTCHDANGAPAGGTSHGRCTACHLAPRTSSIPAMTSCSSCHAPAWGPARSAELITGPLALPGFSHARHAKKAPGAACKQCHAQVAAAAAADLPGPTTADCATSGCHDGGKAFATTEACTRCHTGAPTTSYQLVRPDRRFSHEKHRARLPDATCASCHALDRRGEATAPAHRACSDAACHGADFASTTPLTCGACHVAIEPWRALRADALPPGETEFGAAMPHRRHTGRGLACTGCHGQASAQRELRPPRGHASCRGDGCHAAGAAAPAPPLDDCGGCHRAGIVDARIQERLAADWSVRARFTHAPHAADCESCHAAVWQTDALPSPPAKATCAGCHDGSAAFKMTGHGCARCHGN